jgi:hypothetical protein
MSAQALNGSSNNGYVVSSTVGVATRDASDITRQLKERLIYNGFSSGSTIKPGGANLNFQRPILNPAGVNHIPGNSEWSWLPYGNQFRLSYFFGKLNCPGISGGCSSTKGGVFNGNGPKLPGSTTSLGS